MSDLLNRIDLRFDLVSEKLAQHSITEGGCWEYQGGKNDEGYGMIHLCLPRDKRKFRAHRVSYAYYNGVDPADKLVCHRCDNPSCINPDHLFLGDPALNSADMAIKGRAAPQNGGLNHASKLSEALVAEVVSLIRAGKGNKEIAAQLPITHSQVSRVRLGKSWPEFTRSLGYDPDEHRRFVRKAG